MLKHIITTKCPRGCEYCISKNLRVSSELSAHQAIDYWKKWLEACHLEKGSDINLTGGEPGMHPEFDDFVFNACQYFVNVNVTTSLISLINFDYSHTTVFSLHGRIPSYDMVVVPGCTVYASILSNEYYVGIVDDLADLGFRGLTINEDHRGGGVKISNLSLPKSPEGFSIKCNYEGYCVNDDTPIMLPDGSIIKGFLPYL